MQRPRILAVVISMAVLFTMGGMAVFSAQKAVNQKARNTAKIQKIMHNKKGEKGKDYAAESTAAVEAVGKGGVKADDSENFKNVNKENKDKLYKDSPEVKK